MPSDAVSKLKQLQAEALEALDDAALARREDREHTRLQRFLHFWALVARSFVRNRCPVRASALAYFSLLALVPMLAVVIGITSSFLKHQGEKPIEAFVARLVESVTPAAKPAPFTSSAETDAEAAAKARLVQETRERITAQILAFVSNIRGGTLGATGVITLLSMVILMLGRIEDAFNDIWGVTRGRPWHLRVIQYWFAISLGPLLLVAAAALTSGPYLGWVRELLARTGAVGELAIKVSLRLLPYLILSFAFGLLYLYMPNTKVQWRAAAVGGVVAGVLWQLNQQFSVLYVSRVISNTNIYGSLGAIPVFMIGLYVSWGLLLFGAQVAYIWQNRHAYLQERQLEQITPRGREFAALRLLTRISQSFEQGQPPPRLTRLAEETGIPQRLANQLLETLRASGLVAELAGPEPAYVPARPPAQITVAQVLHALRAGTGQDPVTRADPARDVVRAAYERIQEAERAAAEQVTFQELARRAAAGP
jgi:membrane protein